MLSYTNVKPMQTALNSVKDNEDDKCLLLRKRHAWDRTGFGLQRKPAMVFLGKATRVRKPSTIIITCLTPSS